LWIGTLDGLARYKDGAVKAYPGLDKPYTVKALALDASGRLYVDTLQGLDRLDGDTLTRVLPQAALCDRGVPQILQIENDGTIWMGSNSGLMRIRDGKAE